MARSKLPAAGCVVLWLALGVSSAYAESTVPVSDIQKQLTQLFPTTKATADSTDLVTAGAVLVLQKDHLLMSKVDQPIPAPNVYKNGAIASLSGAASFMKVFKPLAHFIPGAGGVVATTATAGATSSADATREFVAGEKFWVTRIDTNADGVVFAFLSDPINDVRYRATLKFPFTKGASFSPDDVAGTVAEVLKIDSGSQDQGASKQAAAAPAAPKTISIGQTRDEVIAAFGVPIKIVQLGAKEIDIYSDMKVTFRQNKVADVN